MCKYNTIIFRTFPVSPEMPKCNKLPKLDKWLGVGYFFELERVTKPLNGCPCSGKSGARAQPWDMLLGSSFAHMGPCRDELGGGGCPKNVQNSNFEYRRSSCHVCRPVDASMCHSSANYAATGCALVGLDADLLYVRLVSAWRGSGRRRPALGLGFACQHPGVSLCCGLRSCVVVTALLSI